MEEISVEPVRRAINQSIAKDQTNQDFEQAFQGRNVLFKGGYYYLDLTTNDLIGYRFRQVVKLNMWSKVLFNLTCSINLTYYWTW